MPLVGCITINYSPGCITDIETILSDLTDRCVLFKRAIGEVEVGVSA